MGQLTPRKYAKNNTNQRTESLVVGALATLRQTFRPQCRLQELYAKHALIRLTWQQSTPETQWNIQWLSEINVDLSLQVFANSIISYTTEQRISTRRQIKKTRSARRTQRPNRSKQISVTGCSDILFLLPTVPSCAFKIRGIFLVAGRIYANGPAFY